MKSTVPLLIGRAAIIIVTDHKAPPRPFQGSILAVPDTQNMVPEQGLRNGFLNGVLLLRKIVLA